MPAPLLLDLTHTSHTRARTGIQRVARSLSTALASDARAITYDPHARTWRPLAPWETANLTAAATSAKRGTTWPLTAKLRGLAHRLLRPAQLSTLSSQLSALNPSSGLLVPEVFSPGTAAALPALLAATVGPRVAIFHDAIALKFPELTPTKTVARFPAYLRELLAFDGIAAVSEDSRDSLRDYWRWLGIANPPPVHAIPLGVDPVCHLISDKLSAPSAFVSASASISASDSQLSALNSPLSPLRSQLIPTLLSVGSLEGRKNHLALLDACELLWSSGARFELRLIGLAHPQTGRAALNRVQALQAAGRPLRYDGPATDAVLESAYATCAFTVYPSSKASRTANPASAPPTAPSANPPATVAASLWPPSTSHPSPPPSAACSTPRRNSPRSPTPPARGNFALGATTPQPSLPGCTRCNDAAKSTGCSPRSAGDQIRLSVCQRSAPDPSSDLTWRSPSSAKTKRHCWPAAATITRRRCG